MSLDLCADTPIATYLAAWVAAQVAQDRHFSVRRFGRRTGLKDLTLLASVKNGTKALTPETAAAFSRAMGHTDIEAQLFNLRVQQERLPSGSTQRAALATQKQHLVYQYRAQNAGDKPSFHIHPELNAASAPTSIAAALAQQQHIAQTLRQLPTHPTLAQETCFLSLTQMLDSASLLDSLQALRGFLLECAGRSTAEGRPYRLDLGMVPVTTRLPRRPYQPTPPKAPVTLRDYASPEKYLGYRPFLHACYQAQDTSYQHFAWRLLGRKNDSTEAESQRVRIFHILDETRHLSVEEAPHVARALKLSPEDQTLLALMVAYETEVFAQRKHAHAAALQKHLLTTTVARITEGHRLRFCSAWYPVVILELAHHPDFRPDPDWIASLLRPPITPAHVAEALADLEALQLLVHQDGRLRACAPTMQAILPRGVSVQRYLLQHHQQVEARVHRTLSIAMEGVVAMEFTSLRVDLHLTEPQQAAVCERMRDIRAQLVQIAAQRTHSDQIVQAYFWLAPTG